MKKLYSIAASLLFLLTLTYDLQAQSMQIVYSDTFTTGQGSSGAQCTQWNSFIAQLTPRCYTSMKITGTFDPVGQICTDPVIVAAYAAALNSAGTTSYTSPVTGGNVWSLCNRYTGEVWLNPPSQCSGANCPGPNAYIIRPCIGGSNQNWGGVNTNTCTGPTQRMTFTFEYVAGPTSPDTVAGPMSFCDGDTLNYSIDTVYDANSLTWTVPSGSSIIAGQGTQAITVVMGSNGGTIEIGGTNACGTSVVGSIAVSIPAVPSVTSQTIFGPDPICAGDTVSYGIPSVPDAASYMWFAPAGSSIITGQGTDLISMVAGSSSGMLIVSPENSCGVNGAGDTVAINIAPEATFNSAVTGPALTCETDTLMFIAGSTTNATGLNWTVPAGWNIISGQGTDTLWATGVAGVGIVSVTAQGFCGDGDMDSISVVLDGTLGSQGPIVGDTVVCWGDTVTYYVMSNGGSIGYNWSVPVDASILSGQGDTLITVVWGGVAGAVSVTGSNTCGIGAPADLNVSVDSCLVGIQQAELSNGVNVSPNPTSGEIYVTFDAPMSGNQPSIRIFDITGAAKGVVSASWNNNQTARINLGNLPAGVYFLEFQSGDQKKTTKVVLSK